MDALGVIPYRRRSRRLANKALVLFRGRPLIEWAVHAAIGAGLATVLATDSADAREVGDRLGVTCVRPPQAILDAPTPVSTVLWTADAMGAGPDTVVYMVLPTTPLRSSVDLVAARQILVPGSSVVGVHALAPTSALCAIDEGRLVGVGDKADGLSDKGKLLYSITGSVFAAYYVDLLRHKTYLWGNARPYLVPSKRALRVRDQADYDVLREVYTRVRYVLRESVA